MVTSSYFFHIKVPVVRGYRYSNQRCSTDKQEPYTKMYAAFVLLAVTLPCVIVTAQECTNINPSALWEKEKCRDNTHLDLTVLMNEIDKIDWDNQEQWMENFACRCRSKALSMGYAWFALYKLGGMCLSAMGEIDKIYAGHPSRTGDQCMGLKAEDKKIYNSTDGQICYGGEYRAFFYKILKDDGAVADSPQAAEEIAAEEEAVQCAVKSDVLMVVDTSGSIGEDNFKYLQTFVLQFLSRYNFATSRLGLVTFDEKCYVNLMWQDSAEMNLDQLRQFVSDMKYTKGMTLTDNALTCSRDKIIQPYRRPGVPITIFVMTDGVSFNGENLIPPIATELRAAPYNSKMISIGIGDSLDTDQLIAIAGDPTRVFKAANFKNLIDKAAIYLNSIIGKACV